MSIQTLDRAIYRERWAGQLCTLDGQLALVSGRLSPFATIGTLDGPLALEFCWHTVERIMSRDRAFKS